MSVLGGKNSNENVRPDAIRSEIRATCKFYGASVTEVPFTGEDHGDSVLVGGRDHFFVANAATGLDHGADACRGGSVESVAEREERVTRGHSTARATGRTFGCDASRIETILLAGPDSECLTVLRVHDGVRAHGSTHSPRELDVEPLLIGGLSSRHDSPCGTIEADVIGGLDEQPAIDGS